MSREDALNPRAWDDCQFFGHGYVGGSVCVYCGEPQEEQ